MSDDHPRTGRAPYAREADATRTPLDPSKPWKDAGRSWNAQANRLRTYYVTQGGIADRAKATLRAKSHPEIQRLLDRAKAAERSGRRIDRLTANGWIVLYDRRLTGTDEQFDHVAIGPDGVTVVQAVKPYAVSQPPTSSVLLERHRLQQLIPAITTAVSAELGEGWEVVLYMIVGVDGGEAPPVHEWPQVMPARSVPEAIELHPRVFSRMQVADLAMSLETVFPFASTGDS